VSPRGGGAGGKQITASWATMPIMNIFKAARPH